MKIVKVIPLFKNGDPENITNYRLISVLPCFSKVLECIMYRRLYKYYICAKKSYYTQSSLDSKKVILQTMLLSISLIKSTTPLKMNTTHPNSSNVLIPIMFASDTNLLFEHSNINTLFKTVNDELIKINEWFSANKLSLDVGKTKFSLFQKSVKKCSIASHLPTLKINNHDIERVNTIKFLDAFLDDYMSWKKHIKYLENKIAKNIGLVYRAKPFLHKESLLALH